MELNIKQRFFAVGIYSAMIIGLGYYFSNDWKFIIDNNNKLHYVFIVTALALILGSYISEPYFSKPIDVITRWVAILLFLLSLNNRETFFLYNIWIWLAIVFISIALIMILLHGFSKFEKFQKVTVDSICKISRPEFVFFFLYIDIVLSFFSSHSTEFPILIGFGFVLAINKPIIWFTKWVWKIFAYLRSTTDSGDFIGQIIGHESTDLFTVEIDSDNKFRKRQLKGSLVYLENISNGIIGIVINENILLSKKWAQIIFLKDRKNNLISFNIKSLHPLSNQKTIFSRTNAVYLLNIKSLSEDLKKQVNDNPYTTNFKNIIGYVSIDSTIGKVKFKKLFDNSLLIEKGVGEGTIVTSEIAGQEVLYQIIDARTNEENLEHKDSSGFTVGTAQKLGIYDPVKKELNTIKWLPEIYSPLFLLDPKDVKYDPSDFIGRLPNTNYGIPIKFPDELVTHNTAILGILGIGKSCLTFELIKKLIDSTNIKVICIDITNEYHKKDKLPSYVDETSILFDTETIFNVINSSFDHIETSGAKQIPEKSGNKNLYRDELSKDLKRFLFGNEDIPLDLKFNYDRRIRIYNPDFHKVSEGEKIGYNVIATPLTQSEKTRIICEEVYRILMKLPIDQNGRAKVLLVFEEAHSLIPEWNSVANEGDKNATNGTAKVILQGRKFGLGSLVITQRTANISKSILNQCNTIFAMRVFDDTGKQFLENYIGSDYANLLPTLEERNCIVIGKAMKLKQPVIIELNNMRDIKLEETPGNVIINVNP